MPVSSYFAMPDFDLDAALQSTVLHAAWLEFPTRQQEYGRGGWGRGAHRPHPVLVQKRNAHVTFQGKSAFINGIRKLRCNLWQADGTPLRTDYPNIFLDKDGVIKLL